MQRDVFVSVHGAVPVVAEGRHAYLSQNVYEKCMTAGRTETETEKETETMTETETEQGRR